MRPCPILFRLSLACVLACPLAARGATPAALGASVAAELPTIIASHGDAFVAHEESSGAWTLGSNAVEATLGFNDAGALALVAIRNPITGRTFDLPQDADAPVAIDGQNVTLGSGGAVSFVSSFAAETDYGVQLTLQFEHQSTHAQISRMYACYPGSSTIETWVLVKPAVASNDPIAVGSLVGFQVTIPIAHVQWLRGLQGDSADIEGSLPFGRVDHDLDDGERVEIGSDRQSTEQYIPYVLIDNGRDEFYAGVMWSGSWRLSLQRADDQLHVTADFPGTLTAATAARPLEVPHIFFGLAWHSTTIESPALHQFVMNGIRHGRPFQPLVTYNTWFAYGVSITEDLMVAEMDRAAELGVELFVMDAGWWVGAGADGDFDFNSGLGSWIVDKDRFPSSLASLADYARGLGMKFGLWVEPARVALSTVDQPGMVRESWLASHGDEYGAPDSAQICLTRTDAKEWVLRQLTSLIDQVQPDYLKWDNNFWINCDRAGHGHGGSDGNLSHVRALYDLLGELRQRYPDLLIENVAGGGNRLDFGMMAFTDVAWMDDRSHPASEVRRNLEGLTFVFPPAYLLSFVIDSGSESLHNGGPDLPLLLRSRAPGVLGMTYRVGELDSDLATVLQREIALYKTYRDVIADANATLLTSQAPVDDNSWDALQEITTDGRRMVLFAFTGLTNTGRTVVRPRNLIADATYDVSTLDGQAMGAMTGRLLMQNGIELVNNASPSAAHILLLIARQ